MQFSHLNPKTGHLNVRNDERKQFLWSLFTGYEWLCYAQFRASVLVSGQKRLNIQGVYHLDLMTALRG